MESLRSLAGVGLPVFAMVDKPPDLSRVVLGRTRRAPDRELAELTAAAGIVVPGTAEIAEAMSPARAETPAGLLRIPDSLLDLLVGMTRPARHDAHEFTRKGFGCQVTTTVSRRRNTCPVFYDRDELSIEPIADSVSV